MNHRTKSAAAAILISCIAASAFAATKVTIDATHTLVIDGKKVFPIGFTVSPPPGAKAPNGKNGMQELRDAGAIFMRTGPMMDPSGEWSGGWDEKWIAREKEYFDAAAQAGMYCLPWLKEYSYVKEGESEKEQKLRALIRMFKDHPAMGVWKGEDEPQWGKKPIPPMVRAYNIIREEDPNHPVWIVQAPRGTVEELKEYNVTYDIGGVDVYPISYPPGTHLEGKNENKEMSMIGDYTQKMMRVVEGEKPIWFTLQIAWSGVVKPGKTLRFPTFFEERFMTYQAIINGARGVVYFGGSLPMTFNERDKKFGWNWTFWDRVLKPVVEEIGDKSPLAAALVAPNSKLPIKSEAEGIEFCVREVGKEIFILACKRQGPTIEVEFTGLPAELGEGEVLYESPRKVTAKKGTLKDWFAPFDVHVYKFSRP